MSRKKDLQQEQIPNVSREYPTTIGDHIANLFAYFKSYEQEDRSVHYLALEEMLKKNGFTNLEDDETFDIAATTLAIRFILALSDNDSHGDEIKLAMSLYDQTQLFVVYETYSKEVLAQLKAEQRLEWLIVYSYVSGFKAGEASQQGGDSPNNGFATALAFAPLAYGLSAAMRKF